MAGSITNSGVSTCALVVDLVRVWGQCGDTQRGKQESGSSGWSEGLEVGQGVIASAVGIPWIPVDNKTPNIHQFM